MFLSVSALLTSVSFSSERPGCICSAKHSFELVCHHQLAVAQFGIAGMRKKTQFQELQEKAAAKDDPSALLESLMGGADMAQMQQLWAEALNDPATMKQMEAMGAEFAQAMEQLTKLSPDELEKQMQEAVNMLTEDSMVDAVIEKRDEVLKQLEMTKAVPAEELARFKADPEYFELKMRESFDQMKGIFSDPTYMNKLSEAMGSLGNMKQMLQGSFSEELNDDTKIEEARLQILKGDNPLLSQMFGDSEELQELVKDPKKWKEAVKEGFSGMFDTDADKDEL